MKGLMKLRTLMDRAFDEVWFCIVSPDGEEHLVWSADYIGGYEPTLEELEPLLDRGFDEFDLIMRKDPESDAVNAPEVPMIYVALEPNKKELMLRKKEGEAAKKAEPVKKAKKAKKAKKVKKGKK